MEKVRVHIFVKGLTQGVSFRANTKERAEALRLKGWVRNTEDSEVEVLLEGEKEKVEQMLKWLRKGPPLAKVENLDVEWEDYKDEFEDFKIRYD